MVAFCPRMRKHREESGISPQRAQSSRRRTKRGKWLVAVTAWAAITAAAIPAQAKWNPDIRWRTAVTDHFEIHYDESVGPVMGEIARIVEEVHREVTRTLDWVPRSKTHLVIGNRSDEVQGMATPTPYNLIIIHTAAPVTVESMFDFTEWFRELIGHEYVHIVHIDKIGGVPEIIRAVFGRWWVPNAAVPQWMIEGYATLQESTLTQGGRANSTYTDMVLRTAALYDRFPRLDQVNGGLLEGVGGSAGYLFGAEFLEFLRGKHGIDPMVDFTEFYGSQVIPYRVGSTGKKVFDRSFKSLWAEWTREVRMKAEKLEGDVRAEGLREGRPLYQGTEPARILADGSRPNQIWMVTRGRFDPPALRAIRLDGMGAAPALREDLYPTSLSIHPSQPVAVYCEVSRSQVFDETSDLWAIQLESGSRERLTHGKRLFFPRIDPTGKRIVAVQYVPESLRHRLVEFNPQSKEITPLSEIAGVPYFGSIALSPGNDRLAAAVWRDGRWDVALFTRQGEWLQSITDDASVDANPVFSPDGAWVLFDSDRTGVSNLYAWNVESEDLRQITHVTTGAFQPVPVDGGLVYRRYQPEGFDVYYIRWEPEMWPVPPDAPPRRGEQSMHGPLPSRSRPVVGVSDPGGRLAEVSTEVEDPEPPSEPYSALPTVMIPRLWLPIFFFNERGLQYGLTTFNLDPLIKHFWYAELDYRDDAGAVGGQVVYQNDQLIPTIQILGRRTVFAVGGTELEFYQRRNRGEMDLYFNDSPYSILGGYFYEDRRNFGADHDDRRLVPGVLAGLRVGLNFGDRKLYRYSISPEKGTLFLSSWEFSHPLLSGDLFQQILRADVRRFEQVPWASRHVIAARAAGGVALGDRTRGTFSLGGSVGESPIVSLPDRIYMLRGFTFNALVGKVFTLGSLEYRLPVARMERGVGLWPVFFQQLHCTVFMDGGIASNRAYALDLVQLGTGAELGTNAVLLYGLPVDVRVGVARGLTDRGITAYYLRIGDSF